MNKKIYNLTLFLLLAVILISCKENEIKLYDESPRINFVGNTFIRFNDVEYASGTMEKDVPIKVRLQGNFLAEERSFCLQSSKSEDAKFAEITFDEKYIFPATNNSVEYDAIAKVKRPAEFTSNEIRYRATISFNTENPNHQFDPGLEEWSKSSLIVEYSIERPREWSYSDNTWGPYSLGKYLFIMDTLHQIYSEFSAEDVIEQNKQKVVEAYNKYLETNEPILNDDGDKIYFP